MQQMKKEGCRSSAPKKKEGWVYLQYRNPGGGEAGRTQTNISEVWKEIFSALQKRLLYIFVGTT